MGGGVASGEIRNPCFICRLLSLRWEASEPGGTRVSKAGKGGGTPVLSI